MWEGGFTARYHSILEEIGDSSPVSIEWFTVSTETAVEKRTVGDLEVRTGSGAVVVAVIHGRAVDPRPGPESEIHGGDRVALLGTSEERLAGRALIEAAFAPAGASAVSG
jgi:K+/H+ antiporter YhaU regulatory subunit KhtT